MKKILNNLFLAFMLLTRLRIPSADKIEINEENLKNSSIFYPLVGLFFGLTQYIFAYLFLKLNIKNIFIAFVVLIIPYIINKFFHFDGLCDFLDGFLSDKDVDTRLRIMKEPTVGSFALGGAIFFILLKYLLFLEFFNKKLDLIFLFTISVYSRFSILFLSFKSNYPRENGTGKFLIGKLSKKDLFLSIFLAIVTILTLILLFNFKFILNLANNSNFLYNGNYYIDYKAFANVIFNKVVLNIFLLVVLIIFLVIFKNYSKSKIGGITGDVLGASVELSELLLLFVVVSVGSYDFF